MIPRGLLPPRRPETHKGDVGHVLVIAGSTGFSGAAALCSLGALRVGAGLVTLGIPQSLAAVMAMKLTEVMTRPFPETKAGSFSAAAAADLIACADGMSAVAMGPGLSRHAATKQLVRDMLPRLAAPCVVDADGLNALADDLRVLKRRTHPLVVTPHPGEMGRLIRLSAADVQRDRERIAKEFAATYRVVVVLKGHRSLVANVDGQLYVNETGNPGMATAGCGDVLTGMIAGLIGQGMSVFDAARLSVYLHGFAGDLAADEVGPVGLIASDLLDRIPAAIEQYQGLA